MWTELVMMEWMKMLTMRVFKLVTMALNSTGHTQHNP